MPRSVIRKKSDLTAGKIKLKDFIDYQPQAVVSRELLKREAGTVTLFAFDKGQGLSEHTAPFDALVNVIDGRAEVKIAGKAFTVKAQETIIMPAGRPHALQAKERFKMMLVMIKG